jgi:hypothetical protein
MFAGEGPLSLAVPDDETSGSSHRELIGLKRTEWTRDEGDGRLKDGEEEKMGILGILIYGIHCIQVKHEHAIRCMF